MVPLISIGDRSIASSLSLTCPCLSAYSVRSSRGLARLTKSIRKIDETSGIKGPLPQQLGYLENLQELYARRVGIYGSIPKVYGCLQNLRVLSMGNNKISGSLPASLGNLTNLQRIVLHQNKLSGLLSSMAVPLS
jgi:Leucine-rich repeat (LRR) protein